MALYYTDERDVIATIERHERIIGAAMTLKGEHEFGAALDLVLDDIAEKRRDEIDRLLAEAVTMRAGDAA